MKILNFVLFGFLCLTTACNAQKILEYTSAQRGNTGNRGIVPPDQRDKPRQGKDYFAIELKAKKPCTVEIVNLIVKDINGQCSMKPVFEDSTSKKTLKANESYYIRVEKDETATIVKQPTIQSAGVLTMKVNGKKTVLPIEKFVEIMPQ